MKEEDIDKRIERVVKSVASKKAEIAQWESVRKSSEIRRTVASKRWRTYGISAAASVVVIFAIGIGVYINNRPGEQDFGIYSSPSMYRGGSAGIDEIKAMIDSAKYQVALQAIDATIADTIIDPKYSQERQEYLRSVNKNQEYELIWLKIQLLVKLNKRQDAYNILETYVNQEGSHQVEAQGLIEKMKK